MWSARQIENDIAKSKETSRMECARVCHSNAECIGFEYNPVTKDCYLSKTQWRELTPTGLANWWTCEKKEGNYTFSL